MAKATKAVDNTATKATVSPQEETKKTHYQEWDVKITVKEGVGPQAEKLKVSRPVVKITDEQAAILNEGVLHGNNNYAKMYFKPE